LQPEGGEAAGNEPAESDAELTPPAEDGGEANADGAAGVTPPDEEPPAPAEDEEPPLSDAYGGEPDYKLPDDYESDHPYSEGDERRYGTEGEDEDEYPPAEDDDTTPPADASLHTDPEAEKLREEHRAIQGEVSTLESTQSDLEGKLAADYGPALQFQGLSGHCFDWTPEGAPFTYEMCPFDRADQKSSGSPTSIGRWEGFGEGGYTEMRFTNGMTCWNGPARSLTVSVECGEANQILTVDEPEVCKYTMRFVTPAACTEAHLQAANAEVSAAAVDADA